MKVYNPDDLENWREEKIAWTEFILGVIVGIFWTFLIVFYVK